MRRTAIAVALLVTALLTEWWGWDFVGVVVPGYLTSVLMLQPAVALVVVFEAMVTWAIARAIDAAATRARLTFPVFGRDRFYLVLMVSVGVRLPAAWTAWFRSATVTRFSSVAASSPPDLVGLTPAGGAVCSVPDGELQPHAAATNSNGINRNWRAGRSRLMLHTISQMNRPASLERGVWSDLDPPIQGAEIANSAQALARGDTAPDHRASDPGSASQMASPRCASARYPTC